MLLRSHEKEQTQMSYSAKTRIIIEGGSHPFTCPVCKFVLRDIEDVMSTKEHTACSSCVTNFKFVNLEKWEKGWRPSIEEARTA